ncbi:unnamed protein product [Bursaphelenchus okinawaensis]|uniref:Beta-lactamase-related domain-containing protein n=1 Tax=Bursaphelenchus okinawaensis TaxID=465554 RepID=A0A811JQ85_9BILA|nr:unnamed protein product [Bursaphelenchus okinawaensis]CAG9077543.1 unnamed protein product [Bursaphelenchus okinawaensis]
MRLICYVLVWSIFVVVNGVEIREGEIENFLEFFDVKTSQGTFIEARFSTYNETIGPSFRLTDSSNSMSWKVTPLGDAYQIHSFVLFREGRFTVMTSSVLETSSFLDYDALVTHAFSYRNLIFLDNARFTWAQNVLSKKPQTYDMCDRTVTAQFDSYFKKNSTIFDIKKQCFGVDQRCGINRDTGELEILDPEDQYMYKAFNFTIPWNCSRSFSAVGIVGASNYEELNKKVWTLSKVENKRRKADKIIERWMNVSGTPGVTVGVTVNGKTVYSKGFGFSDVENGTKCRPDTVMRIASISKSITATITAKLVERGTVDLEASIYKYLSDFPKKKWENKEVDITIRQLLGHRGGIRHYHKSDPTPKEKDDSYAKYGEDRPQDEYLRRHAYKNLESALEMFKNDPLIKKPGDFSYTTHGYALLAACLEKASSKLYRQLSRELFTDLGMNNTILDVNERIVPNRARYYRRNRHHELVNVPEVDVSYKHPGGGILSNTKDLLKFGNALLASYQGKCQSYLSKETMDTFLNQDYKTSDYKDFYALGWSRKPETRVVDGTTQYQTGYFYHTGAATGCSSLLFVKPLNNNQNSKNEPNGICIVILANCQEVYDDIVKTGEELVSLFAENQ